MACACNFLLLLFPNPIAGPFWGRFWRSEGVFEEVLLISLLACYRGRNCHVLLQNDVMEWDSAHLRERSWCFYIIGSPFLWKFFFENASSNWRKSSLSLFVTVTNWRHATKSDMNHIYVSLSLPTKAKKANVIFQKRKKEDLSGQTLDQVTQSYGVSLEIPKTWLDAAFLGDPVQWCRTQVSPVESSSICVHKISAYKIFWVNQPLLVIGVIGHVSDLAVHQSYLHPDVWKSCSRSCKKMLLSFFQFLPGICCMHQELQWFSFSLKMLQAVGESPVSTLHSSALACNTEISFR